jgi:peptide/nickel transport system permease protein
VANQVQSGAVSAEAQVSTTTPLELGWRKFKSRRISMIGLVVLGLMYVICIFCGFFAPYSMNHPTPHKYHPPQRVRLVDSSGSFHLRPFVYGIERRVDDETFLEEYVEDTSEKYHLRLFVRGDEYRLLGAIPTDIHFIGVDEGGHLFLLGTDFRGRDLLSRTLYGGRVSLTIGMVAVITSLILGAVLGAVSGYFGGAVDMVVQRIAEFIMSFPRLPLWLTLAAALPPQWSSVAVYFGIVMVLAVIGWAGLARQIRAMVLSIRSREFCLASRAGGGRFGWIMRKHLIPNVMSHIIVVGTLGLPTAILSESTMSFLGLGIRPPMTSWGALLHDAQNLQSVILYPWLLFPAAFIILSVLSFNFIGDGLRDAADPFEY